MTPPDVNGEAPDLVGQTCEALVAAEFWADGVRLDPASVVYLRSGGRWHRLYFEAHVVFWRPHGGPPEPWASDDGAASPLVDLAEAAGVRGPPFRGLRTETTATGARVTFAFEGGRHVTLDHADGRTAVSF